MSTCIYCHTEVDWNAVLDTDEGRFACDLADRHGTPALRAGASVEALTERRQLIVMELVCAQCIEDEIEVVDPDYVSHACLDCGAPLEDGETCSCRWEEHAS